MEILDSKQLSTVVYIQIQLKLKFDRFTETLKWFFLFVAIKSLYFNRHAYSTIYTQSNPSSTHLNGTPNSSHSSINNEYINEQDIFYAIHNMNSAIVPIAQFDVICGECL